MSLSSDHEHECSAPLTRAAKLLAATRSVDDIVAVLRTEARSVVGSDGIAVILREGDFCHYVAEDAIEPLWRGQRFSMTDCVSGWAMRNRSSVIIPDIESDPRVPVEAYARTSIRSLAMMPLGSPEPVAAIGAYWCAFVDLDVGTIRRFEILAQVAAAAFTRVLAASWIDAAAG